MVSITDLMEGLAPLGVTREALLVSLRQMNHIIILDERTGVVRSRLAKAAPGAPGAAGAEGGVAAEGGPVPMEVA